MNETLITDLVDRRALDQLAELDNRMEGTLQQFKNCAMELAKGIKIPVEVSGDLDKLQQLTTVTMQRASQAAQQYTQQLQQQQQVVANTTNTISRQLMEQERLNKTQREAFTQQQQALDIADRILGSHEQNVRALARYTKQLEQLKAERKAGTITTEEYIRRELELKTAKQELQRILTNEQKMSQAAAGSFQQLSLQLERLKQAQKQLNEEEKRGADGQALEKEIQQLDAHLKDLAADMGEFQRNVGNYAVAAQNMKGTLRELTEEIAQLTLQYNELSDEEQRSDVGMQMRDKITQLTEEAGKYKDIVSDVKQSISASASDTRLFDSLIEAGQVFAATMGVAETACRALGMSEDSLQQSMLKVQQAMQAVQALQVIQNTLQKQSNLMKGIAILQSKAAAAAARMEAAATASATGATKAQTVAQAAFNLVAKANPYVLLATAILAVIGLIVGYTAATKDATKADEEAKKAAEEREQQMSSFADNYAQSASELIVKFDTLREKWNELGDNMKAREQLLKDNKTFLDEIGVATNNVNAADTDFNKRTNDIRENLKRRAEAQAAYALMIQTTIEKLKKLKELELQEFQGIQQGVMVRGARMNELIKAGASKDSFKWLGGQSDMFQVIDANDVNKARRAEFYKQQEAERKKIEDYYDKIYKFYDDKYNANKAALVNPVSSSTSSKQTGGGKGGAKSSPQVKSAEDIQNALNSIMLSGYTYAVGLEEEYSEKWLDAEKKRIRQAQENETAEAKKRLATLIEDINSSKMSEEEKSKAITKAKAATQDIINGIDKKAKDEEKKREEEITKFKQEEAKKRVETIANAAAAEQAIRDVAYQEAVTELYKEYNESLRIAQKTGEDTTKITEKFNADKIALEQDYAYMTAKAQIDALQKELEVADLSEEERERIRKELAEQTAQLAQQEAEQEQEAINSTVKADEEARKKRQQNLQEWVQKAGEAVQKIGEFISAMYDSQISKIEELLEAEQLRYEQEVEHIDYLAERGAITTEEAEIRKRDAEAATAAKQEQLEKKKAAIEYKKAVMEKANSIAQIGIATALGIMKASPDIPLMAFVGAMGAIQVATALAQPIKAYAEGTKGKKHPGGLAIVGDGDKAEVVMYDGKAWVTPDTPTLVDLPKGAEVLPDADKVPLLSAVSSIPRDRATGQPIVINDYSALESRVATNTKAVTKALREHQHALTRQLKRQKFNAYIASRI